MATREPLMLYTGSDSFVGGVDSGKNPNLIPHNQVSWAENCTFRGGQCSQRPGFRQLILSGDASYEAARLNPQGFEFYERNGTRGYMILAAGGRLFRFDLSATGANIDEIGISGDNLNDLSKQIYMTQAGEYIVVQDGSSIPVIYDGANSRRAESDEVPIGSGPMAFGMGRLWVAQGREYVAGDIEGGNTGVLTFTENDYLSEGGSFRVPTRSGAITAMTFTAAPNTALGQGELLITTPDSVYSTVLPTDRTTWKSLVDPVQRIILINNGSLSQSSTTIVNGDVFMRSRDGIRSIVQAVREFNQLGNVPISREVTRALDSDPQELLPYTSSIAFDNRLLTTCGASLVGGRPIFSKLAVLDFDLVSSMGQRLPPAWDGVWNGYNFIRLGKGRFNSEERAFALVKNLNKGFISKAILTVAQTTTSITGGVNISVTGGGGTDGALTGLYRITSATVFAGGSGYVVGDVITVTMFATRPASFVVTSVSVGAVTGISLINGGTYVTFSYATSYATSTLGAGTGCRVAATTELYALEVFDQGQNYTSDPTVSGTFAIGGGATTTFKASVILDYEWELWEITKEDKFDSPLDASDIAYDNPISSVIETASYNFSNQQVSARERKKLNGGVIWFSGVRGNVTVTASFKPDTYPCWNDWHTFTLSTLYKDCTTSVTCAPHSYLPQSVPYVNLPVPPVSCDPARSSSLNTGRTFQTRLEWSGSAQIQMIELKATAYFEENTPPCVNPTETATGLECTNCGL